MSFGCGFAASRETPANCLRFRQKWRLSCRSEVVIHSHYGGDRRLQIHIFVLLQDVGTFSGAVPENGLIMKGP